MATPEQDVLNRMATIAATKASAKKGHFETLLAEDFLHSAQALLRRGELDRARLRIRWFKQHMAKHPVRGQVAGLWGKADDIECSIRMLESL